MKHARMTALVASLLLGCSTFVVRAQEEQQPEDPFAAMSRWFEERGKELEKGWQDVTHTVEGVGQIPATIDKIIKEIANMAQDIEKATAPKIDQLVKLIETPENIVPVSQKIIHAKAIVNEILLLRLHVLNIFSAISEQINYFDQQASVDVKRTGEAFAQVIQAVGKLNELLTTVSRVVERIEQAVAQEKQS